MDDGQKYWIWCGPLPVQWKWWPEEISRESKANITRPGQLYQSFCHVTFAWYYQMTSQLCWDEKGFLLEKIILSHSGSRCKIMVMLKRLHNDNEYHQYIVIKITKLIQKGMRAMVVITICDNTLYVAIHCQDMMQLQHYTSSFTRRVVTYVTYCNRFMNMYYYKLSFWIII